MLKYITRYSVNLLDKTSYAFFATQQQEVCKGTIRNICFNDKLRVLFFVIPTYSFVRRKSI